MRKINCKHGLDRKQEIEARRFRSVIMEETTERKEMLNERLQNLLNEFIQNNKMPSYIMYLKENDIVIYSAFMRAGGLRTLYDYMRKNHIV